MKKAIRKSSWLTAAAVFGIAAGTLLRVPAATRSAEMPGKAPEQAPPPCPCGGAFNPSPQLAPKLFASPGPVGDPAVDCFMWQTFIYLNWPALAGSPGQPDPNAKLGGPGPVVWETFKPYDQVFLPDGQAPAPWGQAAGHMGLAARFHGGVESGRIRLLKQTSKVSANLPKGVLPELVTDTQADGSVLIDQSGQFVFYEMLMNQDEFNYITDPTLKLYDANSQYAQAKTGYIWLPTGPTKYGPDGAIEVKVAWKVLTPAELAAKPVRFLTSPALISGGSSPVTVGLVGLHIMYRPANFPQGFWATFAQVDNCPLQASPGAGPYSFYNPSCSSRQVNVRTQAPTPTQLAQVIPVDSAAATINAWVQQQLIAKSDADSPFQFYQLLNVQWTTSAPVQNSPILGQAVPLPYGTPNVLSLVNPVLETFLQNSNKSCLGCHAFASVAPVATDPNPSFSAGFSFLFGHAQPSKSP